MSIRAGTRTADGDTVPPARCPAVLRTGPWGPAGFALHAALPAHDLDPAAPVHVAQGIHCHVTVVLLVAGRVAALPTIAVGHLVVRVAADVLRGRRQGP